MRIIPCEHGHRNSTFLIVAGDRAGLSIKRENAPGPILLFQQDIGAKAFAVASAGGET
jgi:hypothetical protein